MEMEMAAYDMVQYEIVAASEQQPKGVICGPLQQDAQHLSTQIRTQAASFTTGKDVWRPSILIIAHLWQSFSTTVPSLSLAIGSMN